MPAADLPQANLFTTCMPAGRHDLRAGKFAQVTDGKSAQVAGRRWQVAGGRWQVAGFKIDVAF